MTVSYDSFNYNELSSVNRQEVIEKLYLEDGQSWAEIAKKGKTYPNRIARDAEKFGIVARTRSEAQKLAIENGKAIHPTLGKQWGEDMKERIGQAVSQKWDETSKDVLEKRAEISRENWKKRSPKDLKDMQTKAALATRKAAKEGSKLEKAIQLELIKAGYKVEIHKEHFLRNERLQLDLFLTEMNIAIEVDGPTHFEDIHGEEQLEKVKNRDRLKDGLILGAGLRLIRVKQLKNMSGAYAKKTANKVIEVIESLRNDKTPTIIRIEAN